MSAAAICILVAIAAALAWLLAIDVHTVRGRDPRLFSLPAAAALPARVVAVSDRSDCPNHPFLYTLRLPDNASCVVAAGARFQANDLRVDVFWVPGCRDYAASSVDACVTPAQYAECRSGFATTLFFVHVGFAVFFLPAFGALYHAVRREHAYQEIV